MNFKLTVSSLFFCLICGYISAQSIDTEKYKFKMDAPDGFAYKTFESGKWGGIQGEEPESKTKLLAYSYTGDFSKEEIEAFGIRASGIKEQYWTETEGGKGESGFEWHQMYTAKDKGLTLLGIIAKNAKHEISYIFFVHAPDESFVKYEEDFKTWLDSVEAIE